MRKILVDQLKSLDYSLTTNETVQKFIERIKEGKLTKNENALSHFCVYFLPLNKDTQEVLIGHHKKSNLWLSPGGHIDPGELLEDTVVREIKEELGVVATKDQIEGPFFFWVTEINNPPQVCRQHFDIWFLYKTDGKNFSVDPREFSETKWLSIVDARKIINDKSNLNALEIIEKQFI